VLWVLFHDGTSSLVNLGSDFVEFAGNVRSMAIQNWSISVGDLTWVVKDNNLGNKEGSVLGWVFLRVRGDVSSLDILDGQVLHVETNIVTWLGLIDGLVMHLNRFDFSSDIEGSKSDNHTGLEDTSLNTTKWDCSNTANFVNILEWETERLVLGSLWGIKLVETL